MFADPASIILFSRCFELGNIYNRTEVLDRSFQGFQDSLMRKKELMMETLELGVQRSLKDMNIDSQLMYLILNDGKRCMKKKWIVGRIGYFRYLRHAFVLC